MKIGSITDSILSSAERSRNKAPSGSIAGRQRDKNDSLSLSADARRLQAESFSGRDEAILSQEMTSARFNAIKTRIGRGYYDDPQIKAIIAEKLMEQTIMIEDFNQTNFDKSDYWGA